MKRKLCKLCFGNRKGSGVPQIFPLNFYTKDEQPVRLAGG
jgi:hypothetical protein